MRRNPWMRAALVAVLLGGMAWTVAWAQGPAEINLKEFYHVKGNRPAVMFPHAMHQKNLQCTDCHTSKEGGKLKVDIVNTEGINNDFHKKFCWPCHEAKHVPKGKLCTTCHK